MRSSGNLAAHVIGNADVRFTGGMLAIGLTKVNVKEVMLRRMLSIGHLRFARRDGHE